MNWRLTATSMASLSVSALVVAIAVLALISLVPNEARKAPPNTPMLLVSLPGDAVTPAPVPQPIVDATPDTSSSDTHLNSASVEEVGSESFSGDVDTFRRSPAKAGTRNVIPSALGDKPGRQLLRHAKEVNVEARPGTIAPVPSAPIPLRTVPDRQPSGVLTAGGIRLIRSALRLTPDQEQYWPPVEAILHEIAVQQVALLQAGREPTEVFGFGLKMRAYSAARPLLGLLQGDQKIELRRRLRAMGFEAVASAI